MSIWILSRPMGDDERLVSTAALPQETLAETPSNESGGEKVRDDYLARLVREHFDAVWRSLRRFGVPSGSVDDAAQRVFVVAARKLANIRPGGERALLMGIAVRVASDARRTHTRRREVSDAEIDETLQGADDRFPSPEELVDRKRARELLDRILATMPMDLRAPFAMFEIEGMSVQEIASALGTPPGTAASRLRRARKQFHKLLRRFGYGDNQGGGSHG